MTTEREALSKIMELRDQEGIPGRQQWEDAWAAARAVLAQPEPEPNQWRTQAVAWLRGKAAEQAQNNQRWPRHAAAYPSWQQYVEAAQRLADELEAEQESAPFGMEAGHD